MDRRTSTDARAGLTGADHLRAVPPFPNDEARGAAGFCARCGTPPERPGRICRACGMGLVLQAPAAIAPGQGEAFLVVDARMRVTAVSAAGERVLGIEEAAVADTPLTSLVHEVGDRGALPPGARLRMLIAAAATGLLATEPATVAPVRRAGACRTAAVGPCGPPPAALVVLGPAVPLCARNLPICSDPCGTCGAGPQPRYITP